MKHFQLFTDKPDYAFLIVLLNCFGIDSPEDKKEFCKEDLSDRKIVEQIENIIPDLIMYYLPCKSAIYLNDINIKRCITILTQFLKLFEYKLCRKERIIQRKKYIYYHIVSSKFNNLHISKESTEISFS